MFTNQENGNAAAMREALELAIEVGDWCCSQTDDPLECCEYSCAYQVEPHGEAGADCPWKKIRAAISLPLRNCDVGKDVRTLLEEYIAMRGFTSDNQIRALYELALPVIEWLLEPTEKMKGESRWKRTN